MTRGRLPQPLYGRTGIGLLFRRERADEVAATREEAVAQNGRVTSHFPTHK